MLVVDTITVRPYETGDDAFVAALADEAFSEYSPGAVPHTLAMVRRYTTLVALEPPRSAFRSAFRSPMQAPALIRHEAPRRVGFVVIGEGESGVFVLNAIAVSHHERGRGVGHRLMQAFESLAAARGAQRLELVTADCNLAALDLFLRRGFRLVRRRERFYERGQNACILVKDVSRPTPLLGPQGAQ
jgi:ribosomal protein S18 acetylase RimI-like enzyme